MKINTLISAVKKLENQAIKTPLNERKEQQLFNIFDETLTRIQTSSSSEIYGVQKVLAKHKLPRYMYHLTTEESYLSMLRDGKILPSKACDFASGTFLFDMKNFTKYWKETSKVAEQPRTTLLNLIATHLGYQTNGNIVLLKIPTKSLDARTMRLRVQEECRCGLGNFGNVITNSAEDKHKFSHSLEAFQYIYQGENVQKAPLYNQRKKATEYIVKEEIPMSNVSLVGKTNVDTDVIEKAHREKQDLPEVWKALTEGQPEQKAFLHLRG